MAGATTGARSIHGEAISNPSGVVDFQTKVPIRYRDIDGNEQLSTSPMLHAPIPYYDVRTPDGADGIAAVF